METGCQKDVEIQTVDAYRDGAGLRRAYGSLVNRLVWRREAAKARGLKDGIETVVKNVWFFKSRQTTDEISYPMGEDHTAGDHLF